MNDVLRKVKVPAIGILITALINIVWGIFRIIDNIYPLVTQSISFTKPIQVGAIQILGFTVGILAPVVSFLVAPVIIYGAIQMMHGRSFGLSRTAAILAVIPLTSCCFVVGVPFGIWALVVLSQPDVKALFRGELNQPQFQPPQPSPNW